jgi:hypothetical protein
LSLASVVQRRRVDPAVAVMADLALWRDRQPTDFAGGSAVGTHLGRYAGAFRASVRLLPDGNRVSMDDDSLWR